MSRKRGQPHKGWKDAAAYARRDKRAVPMVGGLPETYACAYAVWATTPRGGAFKIGACVHLDRHMTELQAANPSQLEIVDVLWFPDLRLARRVAERARDALALCHLRGEWFLLDGPAFASTALTGAAFDLKIPALSTPEYLKLLRSPLEIRDGSTAAFLRSLGQRVK